MFETSQPEPSGGSAKIVAVVIGVVLVVFGIVYFTMLRHEPAATPAGEQAGTGAAAAPAAAVADANPMRDLQILKYNLARDRQTQTMAMWDLQLANRSRAVAYKDIQYATNYYDSNDNLLYSNEGTINQQLDPMDQRTIAQINDGLFPVGAVRYTVEIKGAQAVQP